MTSKTAPRLDLTPSSAERWMYCSASPRFCLENAHLIPADLSSKFSQEGTTAHEVSAAFLQDREPDLNNCPTPIDPEMWMHAWAYMEYVQRLITSKESKLVVEFKQELWYYPGRNAIVDAGVANPESLHIVDLKYGAGVAVSPERNLQAIIYARQFANELSLQADFPIFIHIFQPRCRDSQEEPAKVWQTTWGEVKAISDEIADHAQVILINNRVKGGQLPFAPSEKACRWCPAKGFCPERQKEMLDGLEPLVIAEPAVVPPMPVALTSDQLASVLRHKKDVEKWLDDCEKYAHERLAEGHAIPGFKLVQGRDGNRYWSDEKKAKELLLKSTILKENEIIEESVISVAAVEKLLGKNKLPVDVTNLIARPAGKPTIAPADDPRPECVIHAENEFEALSDEEKDRLDDF